MPAVSESRSRTSLFDFFEGKKPKAVRNAISTINFRTTEETTVINSANEADAENTSRDESPPSTADGEAAALPSESEKALLDRVVDEECHSLRSKTSDNKAETLDTGRIVKSSDDAFNAELIVEYADFHGAGDPVIYDVAPNDDEGVQIDLVVETGDTESGDRSTAVTDAVQSVEINGDAAVSEDEYSHDSEENMDPDSDNASGNEDGEASKDLDGVYESESDDSAASISEKSYQNNRAEQIHIDITVDNISTTDADVYVLTDNDSSDRITGSEAERSYDDSDFDEDNEPDADGTDDQLQTEYQKQDSTRSHDQYDPNSEGESVSSEDDGSEMMQCSELVDFVWVTNNSGRQDVAISGLRETFTPFQVINHDDPGEGNRPESDEENHDSRAFQTRLNKTDGEGLMNIPLSTSFIMKHREECIVEGARTVSELMMALQRKRLTEIAQEGREMEMRRTEANLESGAETFSDGSLRNQPDTQEDEESLISREESRSLSLRRQQTTDDGNATKEVYDKHSPTPSRKHEVPESDTGMASKGGKGKKTKSKTSKAGLTQTNLGAKAKGFTRRIVEKHTATTANARSVAQPRGVDQYPQSNLRKGPKPVLPAISKGTSKSAGQTLPVRISPRSMIERNSRREQAKYPTGYRKSPTGKSPPTVSKFSPRKSALPSIPVQLRSNACFRDGQLEVEIMFDERMPASAEPLEVKVTFVHKHFSPTRTKKASAYRAKIGKKPNRILTSLSPVNRNIIHQRALWPPFNTHVNPEASERHKKFFGSL